MYQIPTNCVFLANLYQNDTICMFLNLCVFEVIGDKHYIKLCVFGQI